MIGRDQLINNYDSNDIAIPLRCILVSTFILAMYTCGVGRGTDGALCTLLFSDESLLLGLILGPAMRGARFRN